MQPALKDLSDCDG